MSTLFQTLSQGLTSQSAGAPASLGESATAIFYSGPGNEEAAKNCAASLPKAYTIEDTDAGKYLLANAEPAYQAGQLSQGDYYSLWNTASQMYAQQATGNVIAFVDGASPNGTFALHELPSLVSDGAVPSINGVSTNEVANIYGNNPANFNNVANLLGPLGNCFDDNQPPSGSAAVADPAQADVPSSSTYAAGNITSGDLVPDPNGGTITAGEIVTGIAVGAAVLVLAGSGAGELATVVAGAAALLSTEASGNETPTGLSGHRNRTGVAAGYCFGRQTGKRFARRQSHLRRRLRFWRDAGIRHGLD
jgi:hypothetical protein